MKIASCLDVLRNSSLALFYPRGCALCGESVEAFADGACCAICWRKTRIFTGDETLCQKCGKLLEHNSQTASIKTFCRCCDEDSYDLARAVGVYENALRIAVLELKEKPFVALKLKNLLHEAFLNSPFTRASNIIPVPLHAKRLRERGFNQAAILADALAEKSKLPVLENCLTRERYIRKHRANMDERARRETVEKAFAVKQPRLIKNENVLLVDDVFTTGATVSLCAQVLKKAGASKVFVFTLARVV